MKQTECKVTVSDTGGGMNGVHCMNGVHGMNEVHAVGAETAAALARFMVSFFADEKHRAGFEKYLAEKRGKDGTA